MNNTATILITTHDADRAQLRLPGTFVWETLPELADDGLPHLGAIVNNDVVSLHTRLDMNCTVHGITARHSDGMRILRRSMGFLLAMCVRKAFPGAKYRIQHSLGDGMFFTLRQEGEPDDAPIRSKVVRTLEKTMREIVEKDLSINCFHCAYEEAVDAFAQTNQMDKVGLLRHINTPSVRLLRCENYTDLAQGAVANRTGVLGVFSLIPCEDGCIMQMPSQADPTTVAPFKPNAELMRVHREHTRWGETMGVRSVGQLNQAVYDLGISDVIQMAEALHDKNYARIADLVTTRDPLPRLVLIAGPSAAGKTTSAKRLGIHLRVNGCRPVTLSTDDYFVGDELNPLDEDGKPDYEHIEALDLAMFHEHLAALVDGRPIKRRRFDFATQQPVFTDEVLQLEPRDILIVEGLHGLNPILSEMVPRNRKFMIFLSALTQLGIDDNNILSTTDNRLIRRVVRDHLFRGHSALETIRMWPSVRRGEERWIFPFQDEADISLNTALDYELAVLRPFADPLLAEIKPFHPEYATARRLQAVLRNFHPTTALAVPGDSVLREYIGGSLLKY
ncbi:MAG: nucleoside kinase [Kiritimatiellia bacterium]|jgi:uridine kinase